MHWGGEGGPQKQIRESACKFHRIDSASVCARALMIRAIANELHMFFTSKTASFVPRRDRPELLYVFAIWYQKHRSRKSSCAHCAFLTARATVMSSNKEIFLDSLNRPQYVETLALPYQFDHCSHDTVACVKTAKI